MKRKTMRNWFIFLFVIGMLVGWLIPVNFWQIQRQAAQKPLQPAVYDIPKKMGQLDQSTDYFKYSILAATESGGVSLTRLDDKIPKHINPKANLFVFVYKGTARATVGSLTMEAWPGQLVVVPAGVPASVQKIGDSPVEMIVFSAPPANPDEIKYLQK